MTDKEAQLEQEEPAANQNQQDRVAELEQQLQVARQEATANWDKYLRQVAEMDNYRKRQERSNQDREKWYKKELLQKVLAVMDNLERALSYQETLDREGLMQGLRMVQWQLGEFLKNEGLKPIEAVGQPFDPYLHEAVESVADPEKPEGTVLQEVLKGYKFGEDLVRPARVVVSSGKTQPDEEQGTESESTEQEQ